MEVVFSDQGTIVLLVVGEKVHCHPPFRIKQFALVWEMMQRVFARMQAIDGHLHNGSGAINVRRQATQVPQVSTAGKELATFTKKKRSELPRLAWVISQSPDRLGNWSVALSALNCYCARQGIPLFLEPQTFVNDGRPWLHERLRIVQKYLPKFQWVFHTDLDVLPVNHTVRATDFLDDDFDLILQDRIPPKYPPNTMLGVAELHASAYFVRNSDNGRRFMQHWLSGSDNGQKRFYNQDNGEMHESILHFLGLRSCVTADLVDRWGYVHPYVTYLRCFRTQWKSHITVDNAESPWYKVESTGGLAVKVYRQLAGYHRDSHAIDPCLVTNPACRFLPGDFLLHGKHLQTAVSPALVDCSAKTLRGGKSSGTAIDDVGTVKDREQLHGVKQGLWLTLEQAREAVQWTRLTTYSGCWEDEKNVCVGRTAQHNNATYPFPDF
jgi:hypothetical protein